MVGFATSNLRKRLRILKLHIKLITLLLRASILPIRAVRVRKSALLLVRQLLQQSLLRIETRQKALGFFRPENSSVLHASARKALDLAEIYALFLGALQDQVHGFEPHCCGREDFALAWVGQYAFCDAVFRAEISVEIYFRLVLVLQVGVYDDAWFLSVYVPDFGSIAFLTFQLLG
jgi:hypothetical protein